MLVRIGQPMSQLAAFLFVMLTCSAALAATPLPGDVNIIAPPAESPPEAKAFSGTWTGSWSGDLETTLIVERIDADGCSVIYSWGTLVRNRVKPGFTRARGVLQGNVLTFTTDGGARLRYKLQPDGTLKGDYSNNYGVTNNGILKKASI